MFTGGLFHTKAYATPFRLGEDQVITMQLGMPLVQVPNLLLHN